MQICHVCKKEIINSDKKICQKCMHRIRNYNYLTNWIGRNILGYPEKIDNEPVIIAS